MSFTDMAKPGSCVSFDSDDDDEDDSSSCNLVNSPTLRPRYDSSQFHFKKVKLHLASSEVSYNDNTFLFPQVYTRKLVSLRFQTLAL